MDRLGSALIEKINAEILVGFSSKEKASIAIREAAIKACWKHVFAVRKPKSQIENHAAMRATSRASSYQQVSFRTVGDKDKPQSGGVHFRGGKSNSFVKGTDDDILLNVIRGREA